MKLFLTLALIISGAAYTLAQERVIDKTEFDAALKGTAEHKIKWAGKTYRITATASAKMADKPDSDHSFKSILEFAPPHNMRTMLTNTHGGKSTTTETLLLGDLSYSRENGGPWSVAKRRSASAANTKSTNDDSPPFTVVSSDTTYFLVGKEPFKGAMATVYRTVENTRKVFGSTGVESESIITSVYWVADGVQRKYDLRSQNRSSTFSSNNVITLEWDLDPTITLIAPQIAAPKADPPR